LIAYGIVGVFLGPVLLAVAHRMFKDWNLPETEVRWSARRGIDITQCRTPPAWCLLCNSRETAWTLRLRIPLNGKGAVVTGSMPPPRSATSSSMEIPNVA
jgi:hypothetical protein